MVSSRPAWDIRDLSQEQQDWQNGSTGKGASVMLDNLSSIPEANRVDGEN